MVLVVKDLLEMWEMKVQFLGLEGPLEKGMTTHSCLENPMDRRAWQATVHRFAQSDTTEVT